MTVASEARKARAKAKAEVANDPGTPATAAGGVPPTIEHRTLDAQFRAVCARHDQLAIRLAKTLVGLGAIGEEGITAFVQNEVAVTNAALAQAASQVQNS